MRQIIANQVGFVTIYSLDILIKILIMYWLPEIKKTVYLLNKKIVN